jgi:CopG family nickel-responsive transcriptional regulator
MERVTVTLDEDLLKTIDAISEAEGYANRSEAMRDILREAIGRRQMKTSDASCVATLSYIYDHHQRDLPKRLTNMQHDHHELSIASMHVHLDHVNCLEICVMKGKAQEIETVASAITTQRGVKYGQLHLMPSGFEHDHAAHQGHEGSDGAARLPHRHR